MREGDVDDMVGDTEQVIFITWRQTVYKPLAAA
jgi:hypothetical protein